MSFSETKLQMFQKGDNCLFQNMCFSKIVIEGGRCLYKTLQDIWLQCVILQSGGMEAVLEPEVVLKFFISITISPPLLVLLQSSEVCKGGAKCHIFKEPELWCNTALPPHLHRHLWLEEQSPEWQ